MARVAARIAVIVLGILLLMTFMIGAGVLLDLTVGLAR